MIRLHNINEVTEPMVKIYEIDTKYFDVPIPKGKTIIKVVTLQDYEKEIQELKDKINYLTGQLNQRGEFINSLITEESMKKEKGKPKIDIDWDDSIYKYCNR